jgi:catalase
MHGFSSHTLSMINAKNERLYVKWHFKTEQGIRNLSPTAATSLAGADPDYAQRDLFEAIERKDFPKWKVYVQIMTEKEAAESSMNPFDLTKVWRYKDYPLIEVGMMELNRNPENYFDEVEQAAFSPSNIVPGLGFSPDKVLQARLFAYPDAQRYRVGTNYQALPVNRPKCPYHTHQRAGAMSFDESAGSRPNYEPNLTGTIAEDPSTREPALALDGAADRYNHREGNDDFTQAGDLYRLMSREQKELLVNNIAGAMHGVAEDIQRRQLCHFFRADREYGMALARRLELKIEE